MAATDSPSTLLDRRLGFALLRILLGVNMLGRSILRLPDLPGFASGMAAGFEDTFLPSAFVYAFAFVIVLAETVIGILLILGWKTRWALVAMGLLMCTLTFGMILREQFGTVANILVYGIAVSLLLFHTRYDAVGIDRGFSLKAEAH
ncbi:MAG: DoxX family membrane protein [Puniceicoccaceae bacterium]|nr:MAG: DoxX family membrane protein [Puniceicoccaceae bacterium]